MNIYKHSLCIGMIRVFANIAMVGAVFLAMYQASRWHGWSSETVFCLIFFGVTIPVWTGAWLLVTWLRKKWPANNQTVVRLPRLGNQLVQWRVLDSSAHSLLHAGTTPISPD